MNFNKSAVAFFLLLTVGGAHAQDGSRNLPAGLQSGNFSVDQLDQLEQEKMRLNSIYKFRQMQAEIAGLEQKINGDTDGEDDDDSSKTANGLSAETLLSQNEQLQGVIVRLQKELNEYKNSANPDSMEHHVYVTRTYTVRGVNKARIFYDYYFNTLKEGDEIAHGVTIASIDDTGIVIEKPNGDTNRILKTTQKRAVIESFNVRSQDAQDNANGFVVPSL